MILEGEQTESRVDHILCLAPRRNHLLLRLGPCPASKSSNWKWRLKAVNGCANASRNVSNNSPTNTARFFPHSGQRLRTRQRRPKTLRSLYGPIELQLWEGRDPGDGHWGCPLLENWDVRPHQQFTPAARRRLAFTVTATATYADAAAVATEWGLPVEDATLHSLVQRVGARAEAQTQARLAQPAVEREPQRAPTQLLNLMIDGCQIRFRGPGWSHPHSSQPHVEWHELKLGVCYRQESVSPAANGRGGLSDKRLVSWRGEAMELGRRLHWEAQAEGLGRARRVRTVNDGAPWIWSLVTDRWPQAEQVLDFYHGSSHLHALAEALHADEAAASAWVKPRRRRLRHGHAGKLLAEVRALKAPAGQAGAIVQREQNYLAGHAHRMSYRELARSGPIGSGTVESACRSRQCRFKRPGQFWTETGLRHLCALQEARCNHHWTELWKS